MVLGKLLIFKKLYVIIVLSKYSAHQAFYFRFYGPIV